MKFRRALVVAVLMYVGCDLALPTMPGAFVFDIGDSVEGLQAARVLHAARPVADHPPLARPGVPLLQPFSEIGRSTVPSLPGPVRVAPVVAHFPRATLEPAPLSEDSH